MEGRKGDRQEDRIEDRKESIWKDFDFPTLDPILVSHDYNVHRESGNTQYMETQNNDTRNNEVQNNGTRNTSGGMKKELYGENIDNLAYEDIDWDDFPALTES